MRRYVLNGPADTPATCAGEGRAELPEPLTEPWVARPASDGSFPNALALLLERVGFRSVTVKNGHPASDFGAEGSIFTIIGEG